MTRTRCNPGEHTRLRVTVRGAVQGVGFRPWVYRLATELGLAGTVRNTGCGACIEVEGSRSLLETFLIRLDLEKPPHSFFQSLETSWLDPVGFETFVILPSTEGPLSAIILPDIATCPECLAEIMDPANRRHGYPFTNCTHCGPRFSIVEALPYDRANTTMRRFQMCSACQAEYEDPANRRFHAQPNACPRCGPWLELWDPQGTVLAAREAALIRSSTALREGQIVALKGLGGFQLLADAGNEQAVTSLRERKLREEKPFALMFPSVEQVREVCEVTELETRLLRSPEAPIVILRKRRDASAQLKIAASIAPGNPHFGAMLPYTPLHHLLLRDFGGPVVATSGNVSDEPICIDEREALERLGSMADRFLVHNRPIVRHVDDSIVRVMAGRELVMRRARGYAPLPIPLQEGRPAPGVLAVGAHLKNAVALARESQVFITQHMGDLATARAEDAFVTATGDLPRLYPGSIEFIAADAHPDYASTRWAVGRCRGPAAPKLVSVQHHLAHVLSCMAENELEPPVLGIAWDGTGLGTDGTIWGGEFLLITETKWTRVAHLRPFSLPGGEMAIREPRRSALGLLYEHLGKRAIRMRELPSLAFSRAEQTVLGRMLERRVNCPRTSSMGRLFDAVAALLCGRRTSSFEGQAAMELEWAAERAHSSKNVSQTDFLACRFDLHRTDTPDGTVYLADWAPVLEYLLRSGSQDETPDLLAARFHQAVVDLAVQVADAIGETQVVLSGGCFQNGILLKEVPGALARHGFKPYWHQRVPTNDGGICLGQVVAAVRGVV